MKRIFADYAYGPGPRSGCWWDETCDVPRCDTLDQTIKCDVVVVGAGYTGISAALHLAQKGASVVVLEANQVGWGASGRNGGFCCLGGGMIDDAYLDRQFGKAGRLDWRLAEKTAVQCVSDLVSELDLDVDRHSVGETSLAHTPGAARTFNDYATQIAENYGVDAAVLSASQATSAGFGGPFHGALTNPIGFGLNPRKYLSGLVQAALALGVRIFEQSPVHDLRSNFVKAGSGQVNAERIIVATNGYSSEDVPSWIAHRYMPAQSTVLVTRPLSESEILAQGWTTDQMAFDTRNLLHYFRLMPDNRFLFGMRGGLFSSPNAEARARVAVVRDFRKMFPEWRRVEVRNKWSGMVCLARNLAPFVGNIPDSKGVLAGFAYHGNGVAMGTFSGKILADLALGNTPDLYPAVLRAVPGRFPLGRARRVLMPPIYGLLKLADWRG